MHILDGHSDTREEYSPRAERKGGEREAEERER